MADLGANGNCNVPITLDSSPFTVGQTIFVGGNEYKITSVNQGDGYTANIYFNAGPPIVVEESWASGFAYPVTFEAPDSSSGLYVHTAVVFSITVGEYIPPDPDPEPEPYGPGDRTVFEQDLGTKQGRIPNPRVPGTYVYELGHADRLVELFADDSMHEIAQEVTADPDTKLLRARVHVKAPRTASARVWLLTARLGDVTFYSRQIEPDGREYVIDDIAVSMLGALPRSLVFRLALGGP